ncbi:hypothetical protein [Lysobacter tyrosinilyticus]
MKALLAMGLLAISQGVFAQVKFPEPDWEVTATGDEIFSGVRREVGDSGPVFVMVDASVSAKAPDNGHRRNTQGTLTVLINGTPCGWDSYGNEFKTSTAAMHVHCFVRGSGKYVVEAKAWFWHCCEGGTVEWNGFQNRQSIVNIYAFRAETPIKKAGKVKPAK